MLYESTNFRLETDDQIATLWLHFQGRSGDVISHAFLDDLDRAISVVEKTPGIDLLIVRNEFPQSFQLGYDLNELMQLGSCSEITDFAARGQQILQRFANLGSKVLTVAFIDGPVSGAGLEIALACDYRLGVRKSTNTISFPEVQRGYLPCFGGTIRLSQLVGPRRAGNLLIENRMSIWVDRCGIQRSAKTN
jgi:enoyl-CoA hydratase/carnithine racemase